MWKALIATLALAMFSGAASAVWIEGYTRADGVYISGHWSEEPRDFAKEDRDYRARTERNPTMEWLSKPVQVEVPKVEYEPRLYGDDAK